MKHCLRLFVVFGAFVLCDSAQATKYEVCQFDPHTGRTECHIRDTEVEAKVGLAILAHRKELTDAMEKNHMMDTCYKPFDMNKEVKAELFEGYLYTKNYCGRQSYKINSREDWGIADAMIKAGKLNPEKCFMVSAGDKMDGNWCFYRKERR